MKTNWNHLDRDRQHDPPFNSPNGATWGSFVIQHHESGNYLRVVATDGYLDPASKLDTDWEHVSVHAFDPIFNKAKTPTWDQMCYVKDLFFEENEIVIQFHPAKADYINVHDHVLHLWRWKKGSIPMPPKICV